MPHARRPCVARPWPGSSPSAAPARPRRVFRSPCHAWSSVGSWGSATVKFRANSEPLGSPWWPAGGRAARRTYGPQYNRRVIRRILRLGDELLVRPAVDVEEITADTQALIDDMVETMYAAQGIGLAASQVGVAKRIFVVDPSGGHDANALLVMVNPEWIAREGTQREDEGCLSIPGFSAVVTRPARAVVRGLDRDGTSREAEGTGVLARAFAHEMDHLDGSLFLNRLSGIRRELIARKIKRLRRAGRW
ncbi:MAG: peptide deformylase [Acidobacteria bacterium]|nr:peptide deformylase [Acidobacteriota bacterium]